MTGLRANVGEHHGSSRTMTRGRVWIIAILDRNFLAVDTSFEEAGQAVEVAVLFDEANFGHKGFGINQIFERNVVQIQLACYRDHDTVQFFLDQSAVRSDPQLGAEHHVVGMMRGASAFIPEL